MSPELPDPASLGVRRRAGILGAAFGLGCFLWIRGISDTAEAFAFTIVVAAGLVLMLQAVMDLAVEFLGCASRALGRAAGLVVGRIQGCEVRS